MEPKADPIPLKLKYAAILFSFLGVLALLNAIREIVRIFAA